MKKLPIALLSIILLCSKSNYASEEYPVMHLGHPALSDDDIRNNHLKHLIRFVSFGDKRNMQNFLRRLERLEFSSTIVDDEIRLGVRPLSLAAYRGNVGTIEALLEAGAAINLVNSDGRTPLEMTVRCLNTSEKAHHWLNFGMHIVGQNAAKTAREGVVKLLQEGSLVPSEDKMQSDQWQEEFKQCVRVEQGNRSASAAAKK